MNIQLLDWQVEHLNYDVVNEEKREGNTFDLSTGHSFSEDDEKLFFVGFKIEVKDKKFHLNIESSFRFELDETITEEFKLSDFPKVNAPAIAFPFLRAFISNLTLQSGVNPVVLPSINFTKANKSVSEE
jgi:preprotein translocase subunit SecB